VWRRLRGRLSDVVPLRADGLDAAADAMLAGDVLEDELAALREAEVVVVNGEGGLYGTRREARLMLLLAYVARQRLGLPTALVNHTADLRAPALRAMAERVYPLLDDVTFREPASEEACRPFASGRVVPDAAFSYQPAAASAWRPLARRPDHHSVWPDRATLDPDAPYVCLGGSALFVRSQAAGRDPRPGLRALIAALRARVGPVVLTASDVPDEAVFRPLARELGLPLIGLATPVPQAVDVLGNAALYLGGRWHPAIFALRGGTPVLPLSTNSHKLEGLMAMVGLDADPADAFGLEATADALAARAAALVADGDALRARLREATATMAERVHEHAQVVRGGTLSP